MYFLKKILTSLYKDLYLGWKKFVAAYQYETHLKSGIRAEVPLDSTDFLTKPAILSKHIGNIFRGGSH